MSTAQDIKQDCCASLEQLVDLSRFYGATADYVIAGGGNTSFKNDTTLWIKGSGVSLGEIIAADFVVMDRSKLSALWNFSELIGSGEAAEKREKAVLEGLMAARLSGEEHKRPSVETLLHDLLPFKFIVHTHPALVNGLTCSRDGDKAVRALFGEDVMWIPIADPGFVLANEVKKAIANKGAPSFFFSQNHGIYVGADTPEEINSLYKKIMDTISIRINRKPDLGEASYSFDGEALSILQKLTSGVVRFARNNEIIVLVKNRTAFQPVESAYTPDHIVYAGSDPLFIEKGMDIEEAWKAHIEKTGRPPKIVALEREGIFGIGHSEKTALLALELFYDAIKVAVYTESFGGYRFMTEERIAFINNWEAEHYRSKQVQ